MKRGVQLYVKRVFVMDECKELMPPYLRFVKGVVAAHDLSLNVSREMLQKDRQIQVIRKQLVRRCSATLEEMKRERRERLRRVLGRVRAGPQGGAPVLRRRRRTSSSTCARRVDTSGGALTSLGEYVGA